MKILRKLIITASLILAFLPAGAYAETAQAGDKFVPCKIDGSSPGTAFTTATITVTDIDQNGNYVYWGVDVGVFKKISNTQWQNIFVDRVVTNGLTIQVSNFGPITSYETNTVYALGYRILYQTVGAEANPIIEDDWKNVIKDGENMYFMVMNPVQIQFTDRVTAANNWVSEADNATYNRYYPDSEVVSKLTIDPSGANVDGYQVTIDADDTNNANITIQDLRVVRIEVGSGASKQIAGDGKNALNASYKSSTDSLTFSVTDSALRDNNNAAFPARTGTNPVTIYFKYKFLNTPGTPEFKNSVKVKVSGTTREITEDIPIYIKVAKGIYM